MCNLISLHYLRQTKSLLYHVDLLMSILYPVSSVLQKLHLFVLDLHESSSLLLRAIRKLEGKQKIETVQVRNPMSPRQLCWTPC